MRSPLIYFSAGIIWGFSLAYLLIGYFKEPFSTDIRDLSTRQTPESYKYQKLDTVEVESIVNKYRVENGKSQLRHNTGLCGWGETRLSEVPSEFASQDLHKGAGLHDKDIQKELAIRYFGENIAFSFYGWGTPSSLFDGWKTSVEHNKNMLLDVYDSTCVRCEESYCVQLFAGK